MVVFSGEWMWKTVISAAFKGANNESLYEDLFKLKGDIACKFHFLAFEYSVLYVWSLY